MTGIHRENKTFVFEQPIAYSWKYYIKRTLLPLLDLFYITILYFSRFQRSEKKFTVVICSIFKDEAAFLKEWIEYHRIVGIEHFYMYNNFSNDHYQEVLKPYIELNLVTLIDWPVPQGQFSAYKHWYDNFRNDSQWVSFLDADEFICPYNKVTVVEWVRKYKNYPCVVMYWKMFGTSGLINHNYDRLVLEQYTVSWDKLYTIGKVLYNTNYKIASFDFAVHHATTSEVSILGIKFSIPPINEFKYFLCWNIHRIKNHGSGDFTIQVNHYWSKAFMIYDAKTHKSDVAFVISPKDMSYFLAHERHNKTVDFKIFRFLIELKEALGLIQRS
jgi:hypothetical protein